MTGQVDSRVNRCSILTQHLKKNKGSKPNKFQVNRAELYLMRAGLPEIWHLRQMGSPPVWTCNIFADLMKTVNQPWTVSVCLLCQCCSKETLPLHNLWHTGQCMQPLECCKGALLVCLCEYILICTTEWRCCSLTLHFLTVCCRNDELYLI